MFSFWKTPTTGVAFAGSHVLCAQASKRDNALLLLEHADRPLTTAKDADLPDAGELRSALSSAALAARCSLRRSVLLLPEDRVYTQLCAFPPASKANLLAFVHDAVARTIPEEFSSLRVTHKILAESAERLDVGVAAVRRDILQRYLDAFDAKTAHALCVTAASCAIVAAHAQEKPASFFLIHESPDHTIVTLFHHLWPVDEALLPLGVPEDIFLRAAESMAAEAREQGLESTTIFLTGHLQAKPSSASGLSTQAIFPRFTDGSWLGVASASVIDPATLAVNFVS